MLALKHEVSKAQADLGNQAEMSLPAPDEKFAESDGELCGCSMSGHRGTACALWPVCQAMCACVVFCSPPVACRMGIRDC